MTIEIRRARREDWRTLRDVRFAALEDTPSAFGSTLEKEKQYTKADWQRWIGSSRVQDQQVIFLAFDGDQCVGIVGAFDHESRVVRLISMWVAPRARRRGLGKRLVAEVLRWTRAVGRSSVELHVTEGNRAAENLYRDMGFRPTDETMPLPSDPRYQLRLMRLDLN